MRCQLDTCFCCGELVFGLKGQDDCFDTVYLQPGDEAITNGAYGSCHVKCLLQTRWGPHWAYVWLRRYQASPQLVHLYHDGTCVAFAHHEMKDVSIIRLDGAMWWIRRRQFKTLRRVDSGWQLPISEQFNFAVRGKEDLIHQIQDQLVQNGVYPLLKLLQQLEIDDKLYNTTAVEKGRLKFREELKQYWGESSISAWINYAVALPDQVYNAWESCATQLGYLPKK
ncbi:MAG: hypothetical protein R3B84_04950 [Zavarzinella sp.]